MSIFGGGNTQTKSLFSTPAATSAPSAFSNPAPTTSLFGAPNTQQNTSLFGQPQQQQQQQQQSNTSLFGSKPTTSLFGQQAQGQQQQSNTNLFGATNTQQQQQQPQQQPQQPQIGSIFGQSVGNRVWNEQDAQPRQKSVQDQIQILAKKWSPEDPTTAFKAYLYNSVPKDSKPFYGPTPQDEEEKWEEALRKAPNDSTIPILVTGFQQLGQRMVVQSQTLAVLQGRLHEINDGLSKLLTKHDLEISARATECRRRHIRLSQKCLALATKAQVMRNRGYAMDAAEEQLRQKLSDLEKKVFDPSLHGRSEEIWARMVTVRDRGIALNAELERLGRIARSAGVNADTSTVMDDAMMKKVKQILEEYDSQIVHLNKELRQVQSEFQTWQTG